jgi:hypothetical protein
VTSEVIDRETIMRTDDMKFARNYLPQARPAWL